LTIRRVGAGDWKATRDLVDQAFRPEDVVSFLDALRAEGCILGEWLDEEDTVPVAHIVFCRVHSQPPDRPAVPAAMLTPMAVRPDRQRQGLGLGLMRHALAELEAAGERLFLVLGHPDFYVRAGFSSSLGARIESPWSGTPAFMARGLDVPHGTLVMPTPIAAS